MLTGHNTELLRDEIAFHVQTEDKGRANPLVVSLIYVGGRVLAAKRTSYAELLAKGSGEKDIAELMDRQHRTMLAAIRHGRFDDHVQKLLAPRAVEGAPSPGENHGDHALEDLSQSLDEMVSEFLGTEAPESLALVLETVAPPRAGEESEIAVQALGDAGLARGRRRRGEGRDDLAVRAAARARLGAHRRGWMVAPATRAARLGRRARRPHRRRPLAPG